MYKMFTKITFLLISYLNTIQAADNDCVIPFQQASIAYIQYKKVSYNYINSTEYNKLYKELSDKNVGVFTAEAVNKTKEILEKLKELNDFSTYNFNLDQKYSMSLAKFYKVHYAVKVHQRCPEGVNLQQIFLNYNITCEDFNNAYNVFSGKIAEIKDKMTSFFQPMILD